MVNEENDVLVSVCMVTYNHERFIRHALMSVLKQKTNFRYEIIVGDDCSADDTVNVIKEIQREFPGRIQLLERKKNLGMCVNSYDVMSHARGRYLANLEGDDYWIDEYKLQKEFDFLENNLDCMLVAHRVAVVNENEKPLGRCIPNIPDLNRRFGKKDALKYKTDLIHPGSWMHRNFIRNNQERYKFLGHSNRFFGGHALRIFLLADMGNIYIMDDIMGAYRFVTRKNAFNAVAQSKKNELGWKKGAVDMYFYMKNIFKDRYDFSQCLAEKYVELMFYLWQNNVKERKKILKEYWKKLEKKAQFLVPIEIGKYFMKK